MRKSIFTALTAILLFFAFILAGCSEDNSVIEGEVGKEVIGSVHGVVTDGNDNARIEEAIVKIVQRSEMYTTETDSLGYYMVKGLHSGNYEVTFHYDGYAVSRAYGYIPTVQEIEEAGEKLDLNYEDVIDHDIYSLTAGLTGKVYKVIEDGNIVPAEGVTVVADFADYDLSPDKYDDVTDASGMFTISGLPSTPAAGLWTMPYNDGTYSFDPTYKEVQLFPGMTVNAPETGLQITASEAFVLTHNMQDGFIVGNDIVVTFNKAIDPASFDMGLGIGRAVKTEINSVTWSNNNMTVTIVPDEDLRLETGYYMWMEGKSADGNMFSDDFTFDTQDGIHIHKTNFQPYDQYNQIEIGQAMTVDFTETVSTGNATNYFEIGGIDVVPSWTNGNKTLSINIPAGYSSGDSFILEFRVTSTLADYDRVKKDFEINIK